jgi:hypothetical protein
LWKQGGAEHEGTCVDKERRGGVRGRAAVGDDAKVYLSGGDLIRSVEWCAGLFLTDEDH